MLPLIRITLVMVFHCNKFHINFKCRNMKILTVYLMTAAHLKCGNIFLPFEIVNLRISRDLHLFQFKPLLCFLPNNSKLGLCQYVKRDLQLLEYKWLFTSIMAFQKRPCVKDLIFLANMHKRRGIQIRVMGIILLGVFSPRIGYKVYKFIYHLSLFI